MIPPMLGGRWCRGSKHERQLHKLRKERDEAVLAANTARDRSRCMEAAGLVAKYTYTVPARHETIRTAMLVFVVCVLSVLVAIGLVAGYMNCS